MTKASSAYSRDAFVLDNYEHLLVERKLYFGYRQWKISFKSEKKRNIQSFLITIIARLQRLLS